ncbi:MAG: hypothetical protein ACI81T_002123 [Bacteroidia bacterium]|jgi:hypothetical protein
MKRLLFNVLIVFVSVLFFGFRSSCDSNFEERERNTIHLMEQEGFLFSKSFAIEPSNETGLVDTIVLSGNTTYRFQIVNNNNEPLKLQLLSYYKKEVIAHLEIKEGNIRGGFINFYSEKTGVYFLKFSHSKRSCVLTILGYKRDGPTVD